MQLSEVPWTEAPGETSLAVLPVGSTEQHGPHAPLGTDTLAARAVAAGGVDQYEQAGEEREVVIAPPIPVGVAEEHRQFTGTLWVSEDTFRAYVRDTVASLASHGWDRVVVVNGHGGNVDPLREVCGRLTRDGTAYTVPFTWFDAIDLAELTADEETDLQMGHGGSTETSLIRHIHPELIDESRLEEASAGAAESWGEYQSGVNLSYDTAEFSENGVVGDPEQSSERLGELLLDAASSALADLLDTVAERDWSRPDHRES